MALKAPAALPRRDVTHEATLDGESLGLLDLKGSGLADVDDSKDKSAKAQVQVFEAAKHDEGALIALHNRDHSDGVLALGEAGAETAREKALTRLYADSPDTATPTVETYFVLKLPFGILRDLNSTMPAAIYARQAHFRSPKGFRTNGTNDYFDPIDRQSTLSGSAVDFGNVELLDPRLKSSFGMLDPTQPWDAQASKLWQASFDAAHEFEHDKQAFEKLFDRLLAPLGEPRSVTADEPSEAIRVSRMLLAIHANSGSLQKETWLVTTHLLPRLSDDARNLATDWLADRIIGAGADVSALTIGLPDAQRRQTETWVLEGLARKLDSADGAVRVGALQSLTEADRESRFRTHVLRIAGSSPDGVVAYLRRHSAEPSEVQQVLDALMRRPSTQAGGTTSNSCASGTAAFGNWSSWRRRHRRIHSWAPPSVSVEWCSPRENGRSAFWLGFTRPIPDSSRIGRTRRRTCGRTRRPNLQPRSRRGAGGNRGFLHSPG
jgi:hypothetical protein